MAIAHIAWVNHLMLQLTYRALLVVIKCQIMLLKTDKMMLNQIKLGVCMLLHIVGNTV